MPRKKPAPRPLKKGLLCLAILLAAVVLAGISQLNSKKMDAQTDTKPFVKFYGTHFLSDFPPEKIHTLPPSCKLVGYTSVLNQEADFYTTGEVSGLAVYQDPALIETLYVKRETEFARYTMTLAQCSLIFYGDSLYIKENALGTNDIPGIQVTDAPKPARKSCSASEETLSFTQENTLPRNEFETNDATIAGSHLYTSPKSTGHLYVLENGIKTPYARITSWGFPAAWR